MREGEHGGAVGNLDIMQQVNEFAISHNLAQAKKIHRSKFNRISQLEYEIQHLKGELCSVLFFGAHLTTIKIMLF